jgi:hypothetical protein
VDGGVGLEVVITILSVWQSEDPSGPDGNYLRKELGVSVKIEAVI